MTGGRYGTISGTDLSSTEVYDSVTSNGAWREVGQLPSVRYFQLLKDIIALMCSCPLFCFSHRYYLKGITLNGIFYVTGGTDGGGFDTNEVLAWDSESETWKISGYMREPRTAHAMTLIRYTDMEQYCH